MPARQPTTDEHRRWAQHNERLYEHLKPSQWLDWAVTAAFYAALHEIMAVLVARRRELLESHGLAVPYDHTSRKEVLAIVAPNVGSIYEALERRSSKARYRCEMPVERDVVGAKVLLKRLRAALAEL